MNLSALRDLSESFARRAESYKRQARVATSPKDAERLYGKAEAYAAASIALLKHIEGSST
jgi:hypothetical protein